MVELAHSLEAVRNYISGHVVPFQSCIEEVRSDNAQLGSLYQQLLSLVTQIGVNSNVVKNDTIPAILQELVSFEAK